MELDEFTPSPFARHEGNRWRAGVEAGGTGGHGSWRGGRLCGRGWHSFVTHAESKPREHLIRLAGLFAGAHPGPFHRLRIGSYEETAEQQVAEAYEFWEALRSRLFAIREDW